MNRPITLIVAISMMSLVILLPVQALDYGIGQNLSDVDASFYGENDGDNSGVSVAIVGDVNGDGYDDFLIGSPSNDENGGDSGQVYLYFGGPTGWSMDTNIYNADATFLGENANDAAGWEVSGAGDVNGDGYDDFLVAATSYDVTTDEGKVYLIFGRAAGWTTDTVLSSSNASFIGRLNNEFAGFSLAAAGDVNGDGFGDFLIGAPWSSNNRGITYLIFGKATDWSTNVSLSNANASFRGEAATDFSGIVSGAGDVNGDGLDDFIIGSRSNNEIADAAGQVYLFYGKKSGWMMDVDIGTAADASFTGEALGNMAGFSLSGTGDVNGDGYDDFLIGAPGNEERGTNAGQVYLILGNASSYSKDTNLSNSAASFLGEDYSDLCGNSVTGAGDVNGDGYDDIVLSAQGDEAPGSGDSGQTYIFLGRRTGWAMDTIVTTANASFLAESAGALVPSDTSGGGDINGDGYDDILLGASMRSAVGNSDGETYLIFPQYNFAPAMIGSVNTFNNDSYSTESVEFKVNDTVYIQMAAADVKSNYRDTATVWVENPTSSPARLKVNLIESDVASGLFRGNFTLKNHTHKERNWIRAVDWDKVDIYSIKDPSKKAQVVLAGNVTLYPLIDNTTAIEDQPYMASYSVNDLPQEAWNFSTDAGWLQWNATNKTIMGTPDNADVGSYYVNVTVTCLGVRNSHNFTLTVENVPPVIGTPTVPGAVEDVQYTTSFTSSDDGQGNITWTIAPSDTWLTMNNTTGMASGVPTNDDVGTHWYNVTVRDGNGGNDTVAINVTVLNTNDPAVILTNDTLIALEDEEYLVQYEAYDMDKGDVLVWSIKEDADWLFFDTITGTLNGTPSNGDVGDYDVNITLNETSGMSDSHEFTITVQNVNDPPELLSVPSTDAWVGILYEFNILYVDVDSSDCTIELVLGPDGMTVDTDGVLRWVPTAQQEGTHDVTINISDLEDPLIYTFPIEVHINHLPIFYTNPPLFAIIGQEYLYDPVVMDLDNDLLTFDLDQAPQGATINGTGHMSWRPGVGQAGKWNITINVSDGKEWVLQSFTLEVLAHLNHGPVITSQDPTNQLKTDVRWQFRVVATDEDPEDHVSYWLEFGPEGMTIDSSSGLINWTPNKDQVGAHDVQVRVTDGKDGTIFQNFTLTVTEGKERVVSSFLDRYRPFLLIAVIMLVVLGVVVVILYKRARKADQPTFPVIDDIFLISKDGRLISHHTRKLKPDVDDEVLGGMFTAIQDFLKTSLGSGDEDDAPVNEISYGEKKVLIEHGRYVFLAAVIEGQGSKDMHEKMRATLVSIEGELGPVLARWDGNKNSLRGVKKWLRALISGNKVKEDGLGPSVDMEHGAGGGGAPPL